MHPSSLSQLLLFFCLMPGLSADPTPIAVGEPSPQGELPTACSPGAAPPPIGAKICYGNGYTVAACVIARLRSNGCNVTKCIYVLKNCVPICAESGNKGNPIADLNCLAFAREWAADCNFCCPRDVGCDTPVWTKPIPCGG
ncbi:hypothetical protein EJ03DRAFT_119620 [Teratosphaeria nubilosa]|uniref:Extracellular membrane protein CFEM domain-containing protein n=1 Tax=Teratosphaeria nubilosa TaxID=161662 RepID=A0A6G1L773_9PEZI|nr:hypothetical protein EJ03DRAFT_119620 [Teratosphaeria nubilosa]